MGILRQLSFSLNSIPGLAEAEHALDLGVCAIVHHNFFTTSKQPLRPIPAKPNLVGMTSWVSILYLLRKKLHGAILDFQNGHPCVPKIPKLVVSYRIRFMTFQSFNFFHHFRIFWRPFSIRPPMCSD